jgi:hypothetical protein
MVLDVQYNALSARVSFNVGYSIISGGAFMELPNRRGLNYQT